VNISQAKDKAGSWPFTDGEMAQRVRTHDWSATPLGPSGQWPANLRTTVQLVLAHPFATIVLWGPDLIQIYNDRYRQLMGAKHPAGLGQPTRECWPEIWHINAPIYDRVWKGESVSFEEAHYPIRRFGVIEDAWFTLSYSPVRDDAGAVAGVFLTIIEATRRVLAEKSLRESEAQVRHTAELLEQLIESAPDPIWTKDDAGRWVVVNSAAAAIIGRPRAALVGLREHDVLPAAFADRVEAQDRCILQEGQILRAEETLLDGSSGVKRVFLSIKVPLHASDGRIVGLLCIARDITRPGGPWGHAHE
jgi:PAS domain S-box-containing protein